MSDTAPFPISARQCLRECRPPDRRADPSGLASAARQVADADGPDFSAILKDVDQRGVAGRRTSRTRRRRLSRPEKPTWSTSSPRSPKPKPPSQTLVSVRDKVIAAYEDILKMPI